ncbi:2-dehydropantoate 2-reductase [Fusarium oxysporum f. sp. pisi HDV247]|uniref:2-dehydropantoate 2-reductase n=1 Tax=Fusarium oxysporum f. sp. pisi HDV247 TaxID=1080344 RepID=W9N7E1_FUSOX|nr:2-dehydropantoate 2-reductase [Fusarium oxysporum f. sp. pisi HDV247]
MAKSRVLVVGTGGIGTMSAYALEQGGLAEVTAAMRSNYAAAVENGIDIESGALADLIWVVKTVPDPSKVQALPFDSILVSTKNIPDVSPAVPEIIATVATPGKTAIVLSQNGISIKRPLIAKFPENPIISSVAYIGATETAPAKIDNDSLDCQKIGAFRSPRGKLDITYDPDVLKVRWMKLAYNATFNPVASILGLDTPRMRMSQHIIDDLIIPLVDEIRTIAKADGVALQTDLLDAVLHQDPNNTAFKPSMWQDCEKGNLMEIENLVGEPLREAKKLNVPAPTSRIVYNIMKGLQLKAKE